MNVADALYGCYAQGRCAQTVSELARLAATNRETLTAQLREHLAVQRGHVEAHLLGTASRFGADAAHLLGKRAISDDDRATAFAYQIVAAELRNLADGLPA